MYLLQTFLSVSPFLKLIQYLFDIEGANSFLSEKLNHDPLEKYFGVQRQCGIKAIKTERFLSFWKILKEFVWSIPFG